MEDQREETEQNDPTPLTDEELAEFQQKENRKVGIIWTIIDPFRGTDHGFIPDIRPMKPVPSRNRNKLTESEK